MPLDSPATPVATPLLSPFVSRKPLHLLGLGGGGAHRCQSVRACVCVAFYAVWANGPRRRLPPAAPEVASTTEKENDDDDDQECLCAHVRDVKA